METNIILFDKKVPHIVENGEILYNLEDLLKYLSVEIVHIDPLIQKIKRTYPCLKIHIIDSSSSKYYLDTINSLRVLLNLNTEETNEYKEWMIKCAIERINEIINPMLMYDRLKTILYKKGVRINYSFIKSEIDLLSKKIGYVELDQRIIDEDIKTNIINMSLINTPKINVVKLPRNNSTNIL